MRSHIFLRLLLCFALLLPTAGCGLLFPDGGNTPPVPTPGPDKNPDAVPDPSGIRATALIVTRKMETADLRALYGLCAATADLVVTNKEQIGTTHDLMALLKKALVLGGWPAGKYPEWNDMVTKVWASQTVTMDGQTKTLEDAVPLTECENQATNVLRNLSLACRDALMERK